MKEESKKKKEKDGHKRQKYVLMPDLVHSLSILPRKGINIPGRSLVDDMEKELFEMIKKLFVGSDVDVIELPFNEMCDALVARAHKIKEEYPEALVVTTAPLIAYEAEGNCIRLNRIVDMQGNIIGIGPRPGNCSIAEQLKELKGKPVIIIEDGSFTGSSLSFLLESLSKEKVKAIILGLIFEKAKEVLAEKYDGEVYCHINSDSKFLDWMPTHDFFPFIPNSGRVVGFTFGKKQFPLYTYYGASFSKPYIYPYSDPADWASLRGDKMAMISFSQKCLDMTYNLFREISKLNGGNVVVGDLIDSNPRTSIPISSDCFDFPDKQDKVSEILQRGKDSLQRMRDNISSSKNIDEEVKGWQRP